jgi:hypothetical protein
MNTIQNYPMAVLLSLLAWILFSVGFCFLVGLIAMRVRQRRDKRKRDRLSDDYHGSHPGSPAA